MSDIEDKNENIDEAYDALVGVSEMLQEQNYSSLAQFFDHLFAAFSKQLNTSIVPGIVESSYTGIHLGETYEENDFVKMANSFLNNQTIHAKYALKILSDGVNLLKKMDNIRSCDLNQSKTELPGVVIVGDLHGNYKDLFYIIKKWGTPGKLHRIVFNGDIVDRGPQQIECLLTILYAFLMYPTRVFINRGNHEDKSCNLSKHFHPNFKTDCDLKFGKYNNAIFNEAIRVFRYLPLATVVKNKVGYSCFITHGGLSSRLDLNFISRELPRHNFEIVSPSKSHDSKMKYAAEQMSDLLWSDPLKKEQQQKLKLPSELGCYPNSARGLGWLFGADVTENFCRKYGFSSVIRSHEVRPEGMSQDHPRLFTIFSCSYYCNGSNKAAILYLPAQDQQLQVHKFSTEKRKGDEAESERVHLIQTFKRFLTQEKETLLRRFKREDPESTGYISLKAWSGIISRLVLDKTSTTLEPIHIISLKDNLCPCEDEDQTAKYAEMFDTSNGTKNSAVMDLLEQIFVLIDTNRSGTISKSEATQAVSIINEALKTNYDHHFISDMDADNDGEVDLEEFKTAFANAI